MNQPVVQEDFILDYIKNFGIHYNDELFERSTDLIIKYLKDIISASERTKLYIIKPIKFEVIEDYDKINQALRDYEYEIFLEKTKDSKVKKVFDDSKFNLIDMNESYIKLLRTTFYLSINNEYAYVTQLVQVPRYIDKYYFHLFGSDYISVKQIVDASTYNNSASKTNKKNSKKQNVAFKTTFMKTQIFREFNNLKTTTKETVRATNYISAIFSKRIQTTKYIFGKMGYYQGLDFLNMRDAVYVTDFDPQCDELYTFCKKANNIYVSTPKMLFDNQEPVQALVYCIYKTITKEAHLQQFETKAFWLKSIGEDFGNATVEKGIGIIDSLDHIYDPIIQNVLRLPEHKKRTIYDIFKWMMGDYNALRQKDNLDISTKRVRAEEVIACHFALPLVKGIYRVSDMGKDAKIKDLIRAVRTPPDVLIRKIINDSLTMTRNNVNSDDGMYALKFSFKGLSGIGENSKSSIPDSYRAVNPSHIGRIDVTSSSNSDPGITGILCPMCDLYNGSFSEFEEPNGWEDQFNELIELYNKSQAKKNILSLEKSILGKHIDQEKIDALDEEIDRFKGAVVPFYVLINDEK